MKKINWNGILYKYRLEWVTLREEKKTCLLRYKEDLNNQYFNSVIESNVMLL